MIFSPNLHSKILLPGAVVWSPLEAAVLAALSAAEEPRALHGVTPSVGREAGQ